MDISSNAGSVSATGFLDAKASSEGSIRMASAAQFASAVSSGSGLFPQNFDAEPTNLQEGASEAEAIAQSCRSPTSLMGEDGGAGADEPLADPHGSSETQELDAEALQGPKHEESLLIDGWPAPSLCREHAYSIGVDALPASAMIQISEVCSGEHGSVLVEEGAMQEQEFRGTGPMAMTDIEEPASTDTSPKFQEITTINMQTENKGIDVKVQVSTGNSCTEVAVAEEPPSTDLSALFEESVMNTVNAMETGNEATDDVEQEFRGTRHAEALVTEALVTEYPGSTDSPVMVEESIIKTKNSMQDGDQAIPLVDATLEEAEEDVPAYCEDQAVFRESSCMDVAVAEEPASTSFSANANESIINSTDSMQTAGKATGAVDAMQKKAAEGESKLVTKLQEAEEDVPVYCQDQAVFRESSCMEVAVAEEPASTSFSANINESIINSTDSMQTAGKATGAVDVMQEKTAEGESKLVTKLQYEESVVAPSPDPIIMSGFAKDEKLCATSISAVDPFETASIMELQNMLIDSSLKHPEIALSLNKSIVEMTQDRSKIFFVQETQCGDLDGMDAVVKREVNEGTPFCSSDENLANSVEKGGPDEQGLDAVQLTNYCSAVVVPQKTEDIRAADAMDHGNFASGIACGVVVPQSFNTESTLPSENGIKDLQKAELKRETEEEGASKDPCSLSVSPATATNESMEINKDIQDIKVPLEAGPRPEAQIDSESMPAEDVLQEPPPIRKRGRKPGKKSVKHLEKNASIGLLQESEPEKESPSKHPIEEQKRELRKRGRKPATLKVVQKHEEDVCFVCFDGGKLILCDKRFCPKAYHVECTGRESEFFEKKGQWFCGWHVCSRCSKSAHLNCFMCPTALCSSCVKGANFLIIQKDRGLCEGCYPLVHMIEYCESVKGDPVQVDFSDKETYEGLFKEYWEDVKVKHSLSSAEFKKACKAREAGGIYVEGEVNNDESAMDAEETIVDESDGSTDSEDRPPTIRHARLMKRKRLARQSVVDDASASDFEGAESDDEVQLESTPKKGRARALEFDGWASKELADLIRSLKEDPKKPLPLFGVKKLLWRYIDDNKLTNPRKRGQILCDERLRKLFGKKLVGRFEMMKLISLHVASPSNSMASRSGELQYNDDTMELDDIEENQVGKKKVRRKADDKYLKPDPSEYAAINVKNINLIYLKRSVLDELRNDPELETKAVGAFVRIRIPGSANKTDACYRLVQVIGVKQIYDALDPEKVTDVILEIQNLHKREEVTADLVSNQELVEEECQRLRQSVRCGLIQPMRVGELEERARALREAKVKDWREYELLRLSHLRDRASEKGRKKELRECVEKLQLLSTQEEKERLLNAPFDIDADPFMDPAYESEEEDSPADDEPEMSVPPNAQEKFPPSRLSERGNSSVSAERPYNYRDGGSGFDFHKTSHDIQQKAFAWGPKDSLNSFNARQTADLQAQGWNTVADTHIDKNYTGPNKTGWGDGARGRDHGAGWNHGSVGRKETRWNNSPGGNVQSIGGGHWRGDNVDATPRFSGTQPEIAMERSSGPAFLPTQAANPVAAVAAFAPVANTGTMVIDSEKEKVWCYLDPTRTVQGPFTMEQLRKWEKTNLFPLDLHIWRVTESQDTAVLLSDALAGRFSTQRFLGPSQNPNFAPSSAQGNHVSGIPVQGLNNFPMGQNVGNVASCSAQGVITSPMLPQQRPVIQGFPSSVQGPNAQSFTPGPVQGPNSQGFSSANHLHTPNVHGFPMVPSQGTSVHTFGPSPTQGPHVNNFPVVPLQGAPIQGPNVTGYPPPITQGLNVVPGQGQPHLMMQGRPQGPNVAHGQMQGSNANPTQAQMPNVLQGSHFGNAQAGHPRGPHANHFPMGANTGAVHNNASQIRHSNEWQDMDRRPGPDQHFGGPSPSMRGAPNDGGARGMPSRNPWRQGPGAPHQDQRDPHNRGQFGRSQSFRGSDQFHGSDSRFLHKKDLFCKYFSRGLCKKGQSCDFRHE